MAKTWLDRSVEVSAELERARDELEKANETILSMKIAAEKSSGEVSVLKSRISMLEVMNFGLESITANMVYSE